MKNDGTMSVEKQPTHTKFEPVTNKLKRGNEQVTNKNGACQGHSAKSREWETPADNLQSSVAIPSSEIPLFSNLSEFVGSCLELLGLVRSCREFVRTCQELSGVCKRACRLYKKCVDYIVIENPRAGRWLTNERTPRALPLLLEGFVKLFLNRFLDSLNRIRVSWMDINVTSIPSIRL